MEIWFIEAMNKYATNKCFKHVIEDGSIILHQWKYMSKISKYVIKNVFQSV